nr:ABC transporter substrate-binding protein [Limobrevibacterium gyesilva]
MAGAVDVVVADWLFVANQRAAGTKLCFAPFSAATGGVLVRHEAPIRTLGELRDRRLGVAGGPTDKSWLVVQAAGRSIAGIDLAAAARVVYGAPPLLGAKLEQGELDAVLTFWNFAARLLAAGCREVISVADCSGALGLPATTPLIGYVFHEDWAEQHRAAIDGFLAAARAAEDLLATSDAEWQSLRRLMDAEDDTVFAQLRARFVAGISHPSVNAQQAAAQLLLDILMRTGGEKATGGVDALPAGVFWRATDREG